LPGFNFIVGYFFFHIIISTVLLVGGDNVDLGNIVVFILLFQAVVYIAHGAYVWKDGKVENYCLCPRAEERTYLPPELKNCFSNPLGGRSNGGSGSIYFQVFGYGVLAFFVPLCFAIVGILAQEIASDPLNVARTAETAFSVFKLIPWIVIGSIVILITAEFSTLYSLHGETAPFARDSLVVALGLDVSSLVYVVIFTLMDGYRLDGIDYGAWELYAFSPPAMTVHFWLIAIMVSLLTLVRAKSLNKQFEDVARCILHYFRLDPLNQKDRCPEERTTPINNDALEG